MKYKIIKIECYSKLINNNKDRICTNCGNEIDKDDNYIQTKIIYTHDTGVKTMKLFCFHVNCYGEFISNVNKYDDIDLFKSEMIINNEYQNEII